MFFLGEREIQTILFNILKTKQVNLAECVVIAWILLVIGADSQRIRSTVSGRIVIFTLKVWFSGHTSSGPAGAEDLSASVDRIIAIATALQIDCAGCVETVW